MAYDVLSPRHVRYTFEGPRESAGLRLGHHIAPAHDGLPLHALIEFDDGPRMAQTRFVFARVEEIAFRGADRDAFLRRGAGDHLDLYIFEPPAGSNPDLSIPGEIENDAQQGAERMRLHLMREHRSAMVRRKNGEAARNRRLRRKIRRFSFAKAHGKSARTSSSATTRGPSPRAPPSPPTTTSPSSARTATAWRIGD